MDIQIPVIPIGVLTLLSFFAPYAIAALNGVLPFVKEPWQKKLVTVIFAILLGAFALVVYAVSTGDFPTSWWAWLLLAVVVTSASYSLVLKKPANRIEAATTNQ